MTLLVVSLLAGCWKPYGDLPQLDFTEVPYSNEHMSATDAVISAFDTTLDCPDGSDARFFAVYRKGLAGKAPVAIVLHSGAFDYVIDPDPTSYLSGEHYAGESRLDRGWAISKVWETLGINPVVIDSSEVNAGTLPAALTDGGFVQLYPANCWGDMWHNYEGRAPNEYEIENFDRNGQTFAHWMIKMIVEPSFASGQGFQLPVGIDTSQVFLVGLGEGGRGAVELMFEDNLPLIQGLLMDSTPDDLTPYTDDPVTYAAVVEGLSRIFREENLGELDQWSVTALYEQGLLPARTGLVWSPGDTRLPEDTMSPAAELLESLDGQADWETWSYDTAQSGHVFLNGDAELARKAVNFLQNGTAAR